MIFYKTQRSSSVNFILQGKITNPSLFVSLKREQDPCCLGVNLVLRAKISVFIIRKCVTEARGQFLMHAILILGEQVSAINASATKH